MQFNELNINPAILHAIEELNYTTLTEVQAEVIPQILKSDNAHLFAQGKTGTGKTVAYSIPIAQKIDPNYRKVQAVILVPTRELCNQVNTVISNLTKYQKITTVEIYGGVSYNPQIKKIKNGAQIVIATPGRFIDIFERGSLKLDHVKYLVLDEADRMLDFGFMPAIEHIFNVAMQAVRPRIYFFSATLKDQIYKLAERFIGKEPAIKVDVSHDTVAVQSCHQYYYVVENQLTKFDDFVKIFNQEQPGRSIIFVNKRETAIKLTKSIRKTLELKIKPDFLQGDLTQKQREETIQAFRENKIDCLIATDVAARGLDFMDVTHVFNYDIPCFEEDYAHRIGRTSRMERSGTAISICAANQKLFLTKIEKFMKQKVEEKTLPGVKIEFKGGESHGRSRSRSRRRHTDREERAEPFMNSEHDNRSERKMLADLSKRGFKFDKPEKSNRKTHSDHGFYSSIVERKQNSDQKIPSEKLEHTEHTDSVQSDKVKDFERAPRSIRKTGADYPHHTERKEHKEKSDHRGHSEHTVHREHSDRPPREGSSHKKPEGFFDQQKSLSKDKPRMKSPGKREGDGVKHKSPSKIRRLEFRKQNRDKAVN